MQEKEEAVDLLEEEIVNLLQEVEAEGEEEDRHKIAK